MKKRKCFLVNLAMITFLIFSNAAIGEAYNTYPGENENDESYSRKGEVTAVDYNIGYDEAHDSYYMIGVIKFTSDLNMLTWNDLKVEYKKGDFTSESIKDIKAIPLQHINAETGSNWKISNLGDGGKDGETPLTLYKLDININEKDAGFGNTYALFPKVTRVKNAFNLFKSGEGAQYVLKSKKKLNIYKDAHKRLKLKNYPTVRYGARLGQFARVYVQAIQGTWASKNNPSKTAIVKYFVSAIKRLSNNDKKSSNVSKVGVQLASTSVSSTQGPPNPFKNEK